MRTWLWWLLVVSSALAVAAFGYPTLVIQPFQTQDPAALAVALTVREWGPVAAAILAGIAMLCTVWLWRDGGVWTRVLSVVLALAAGAGAALTRVNVFEQMYAPVSNVRAEAAAESKLDPDDMVLAVTLGGVSRAYSIRMLAYHHLVNDRLEGVPLVGTY